MTTLQNMEVKISQVQLDKVVGFLNDTATLIASCKGKIKNRTNEISDRYSLPYSYFKIAQELGFFFYLKNEERYTFNKPVFEPIHARQLIIAYRNYTKQLKENRRNNPPEPKNKATKKVKKYKTKVSEPYQVIIGAGTGGGQAMSEDTKLNGTNKTYTPSPKWEIKPKTLAEKPTQKRRSRKLSLLWGLITINF